MNEITLAKVQFKDALEAAGLDVKEYLPDRITPPVVIVMPNQPYLTPETVGSEYTMNLEVVCIAATASNETASEQLDELIESVLNALPAYAGISTVGKPYALATGNAEYLSSNLNVTVTITI